jgi:hypothetical protein
MKKFSINGQLRNKHFLIIIYPFSLVKAAMNAPRLCKLCIDYLTGTGHGAMVFTKRLNFLFCQFPKVEQRPLHPVDWLPNWQSKNKEAL